MFSHRNAVQLAFRWFTVMPALPFSCNFDGVVGGGEQFFCPATLTGHLPLDLFLETTSPEEWPNIKVESDSLGTAHHLASVSFLLTRLGGGREKRQGSPPRVWGSGREESGGAGSKEKVRCLETSK